MACISAAYTNYSINVWPKRCKSTTATAMTGTSINYLERTKMTLNYRKRSATTWNFLYFAFKVKNKAQGVGGASISTSMDGQTDFSSSCQPLASPRTWTNVREHHMEPHADFNDWTVPSALGHLRVCVNSVCKLFVCPCARLDVMICLCAPEICMYTQPPFTALQDEDTWSGKTTTAGFLPSLQSANDILTCLWFLQYADEGSAMPSDDVVS